MEHRWIDPQTNERQAVLEDGRPALSPAASNPREAVLAREILRLAQREAELLASIESQRGSHARAAESQAQRIAALEFDLAAAKRANEILGGMVNRLEEELRSTRANFDANAARLAASETRGRAYCLELAEKAEEIRQLRWDSGNRLIRARQAEKENERLQAAVEDGIAHVERSRLSNLHDGEHGRQFRAEQLDLAHEALCGATVPRVGSTGGGLADRVADLEEGLGKLAAATNPSGKPPTYARLDSLEESRSNHAVMLTDHADRLKAVAEEVDHLREDFLASTEDFQRRLAALEAGKE